PQPNYASRHYGRESLVGEASEWSPTGTKSNFALRFPAFSDAEECRLPGLKGCSAALDRCSGLLFAVSGQQS
ncbi:MAG: hypothetical protein ACK53L_01935, partial [Pirellulaceae bacterium]